MRFLPIGGTGWSGADLKGRDNMKAATKRFARTRCCAMGLVFLYGSYIQSGTRWGVFMHIFPQEQVSKRTRGEGVYDIQCLHSCKGDYKEEEKKPTLGEPHFRKKQREQGELE